MTGPIGSTPDQTALPDDAHAELSSDQRLQLVSDLARQVTARHDLGDVLAATLAGVRRLASFAGGSIQLLDDDGWIRMAAADPPASEEVLALRIPLGSTVGGRVILTERPVYLADVHNSHPGVAEGQRPHVSGGVRSYLGIPLLAEGRAIGLLQLDHTRPDAWDEHDRLLLACVAPIVAAAIQNARAHARVATMASTQRRNAEQLAALIEALDGPVEKAIEVLAASAGDHAEDARAVDQLRSGIAHVRATLATQVSAGAPPQTSRSAVNTNVDLRTTDHMRV